MKKEIKRIKKLLKYLKPAVYKYRGSNKKSFGFIAQDLIKIFPPEKYDLVQRDKNGFFMVNYYQFIPFLFMELKKIKKQLKHHK